MFTFGERTFTFGDNRGFPGFLEFFLLLGGFGTPWIGGPVGVFILSHFGVGLPESLLSHFWVTLILSVFLQS